MPLADDFKDASNCWQRAWPQAREAKEAMADRPLNAARRGGHRDPHKVWRDQEFLATEMLQTGMEIVEARMVAQQDFLRVALTDPSSRPRGGNDDPIL